MSGESAPDAPAFEPWGDVDAGAIDVQERLGLGGMGEVRKGWDNRKKRTVALKLLRSEDPAVLRRFVHEAKALASCDHPAICRVYGLVTVEKRPCIVMQYVSGGSLHDVYPSLSVTERVRVARTIAEALAHAHSRGLVHFDVKPSNVLVDQSDDGSLRPLLSDFGSARERDRTLHTMTNSAVVTPEYMAPELLGAVGRSDARADVYGLGATLYHVLTEHPPFRGSTAEVLRALAQDEPVPVRKMAPKVHPDLARIVEAAMRKDPALRYSSASEVAADLGRFLDGQPVLAPQPSLLARLASRARSNRAVTGVVAAIAVALVVTTVFAVSLRMKRERETREAEAYLHDVERLEATLRQGAVRPLHDLDDERSVVTERLGELEAALPTLHGRAVTIVHYALGRGYLGLGDHERARTHLQYAWDHGEHSPDLALALGRSLGESYRDALDEAERISDEKERTVRRAEIARELRDPALGLLHQGANAVLEAPELLEAQMAFYEGRHDDALELAERARGRAPGLFEAKRLEGDVLLSRASERREHGDYATMRASLAGALAAYAAALREAPSHLESLVGACATGRQSLTAAYDQSLLDDASFEPVIVACDDALRASSRSTAALRNAADALGIRARYGAEHGRDAREDYERSITLFRKAGADGPAATPALLAELGTREELFATYLESFGEADSAAAYDEAIATLERAVGSREAGERLAWSLGARGLLRSARVLDDEADFVRGRTVGLDVVKRWPTYWHPKNELGEMLLRWSRVDVERGRDARPHLDEALEAYEAVQQMNPDADYGFVNTCELFSVRARFDLDTGIEPRSSIAQGRAACERGMTVDPNYADTHRLLADTFALAAEDALARSATGEVPPLLDAGRAAIADALRIDPRSTDALHARATLALLDARARDARGADPSPALDEVARAIDDGRALAPHNAWQNEARLKLALARATYGAKRGASIAPFVDSGLAAASAHLAARPYSARVLRDEGELELVAARAAARDPARRAASARAAAEHLTSATTMNPNLARAAQPLLDEARRLAAP